MTENFYSSLKKIRGDWGGVKPYTRIEKDKKKYSRKEKHKKDLRDFSENQKNE